LIERLRKRVGDSPMAVKGSQIRVTFSAGIVSVTAGESLVPQDLLRRVEQALEDSKETGRNRTNLAPPSPPPAETDADPEASALKTQT
jgi:PleD family two-component response regulator